MLEMPSRDGSANMECGETSPNSRASSRELGGASDADTEAALRMTNDTIGRENARFAAAANTEEERLIKLANAQLEEERERVARDDRERI